MSLQIKIIPEDPTDNGYILKPLVERLLHDCGRPNAKVTVLSDPRVRGIDDAKQKMPMIVERYRHFDLLIFIVDNDGQGRAASFPKLESDATLREGKLICCAAIEEVEAWLLAGHVDKIGKLWSEIRGDTSVKENVFQPFLIQHGRKRPGGGRDILMRETLSNYTGLLQRCPELAELRDKIVALIG